jgi:sn-glycerol 3-phosphate transport system permease protein
VTIVPLYWMFATSLKPANEIFNLAPLPVNPTFANYAYAFKAIPIGAMLATTLSNAVLQHPAAAGTSCSGR